MSIRALTSLALIVVLFGLFVHNVESLPNYNQYMPNGYSVPCNQTESIAYYPNGTCIALGHTVTINKIVYQYCGGDPAEGVQFNNNKTLGQNGFGLGFSLSWSRSNCLADPDGDGLYNGMELGDPLCFWAYSSEVTPVTLPTGLTLSHPGSANSVAAGYLGLGCFLTSTITTGNPPSATVPPTPTINPTSLVFKITPNLPPAVCAYNYTFSYRYSKQFENNTIVPPVYQNGTLVSNGTVINSTYTVTYYNTSSYFPTSYAVQTFILADLPLATVIYYTLTTANDFGHSTSAETFVTTKAASAPQQPTGINVTAIQGTGSASVQWTPPSDTGGLSLTNYTIYLSDIASTVPLNVSGTLTQYTMVNLTIARTYRIQMAAFNGLGSSDKTKYLTFTTSVTGAASNMLPLYSLSVFLVFVVTGMFRKETI